MVLLERLLVIIGAHKIELVDDYYFLGKQPLEYEQTIINYSYHCTQVRRMLS